ncbi:hypothetical protein C8N40_106162 [Pontibacter mucosus]|uniref:Uncharacterized protein n=1 Tax=Pontibacter mucosus TaxID=1649266 RepID=A0A2T5YGB6_9BACT|nr:hypothetical protein [Pontibacter mucosus]PTX18362.1 hypothetical protein C8N40_106162 [Pontibacter mucosus]
MKTLYKILPVFFFLFLISCSKEDHQVEPVKSLTSLNKSSNAIATYPLNWENIDLMPTPPGTPLILVPWASGASRQFTSEIANDYKSSDGWMLVYNTFNTQHTHDNLYFILYNKYRGLIRMYYYVPSSANYISSANIIQKLAIEGPYAQSSPMLNFSAQEFVDVNTNSRFASSIEQWQVARSTWYVLQHELAYDENMSTQSYSSFNFFWPIRSGQLTNISLNGTVTGSLTGTVSTPGIDFTLSPNFSIDKSRNKSTITVNGSSDADKLKPTFGSQIMDALKSAIISGVKSGGSGVVSNFISGIFKKNTTTTPEENVNLKIKADVSLTGQLTSDFLITSPAFSIPGYNQTFTTGFVPAYNKPLGVFYLSSRPLVRIKLDHLENPEGGRLLSDYKFQLDNSSYNIIYNPEVLNIASITNVNHEVLIDDHWSIDPIEHGLYESVDGSIYQRIQTFNGNFLKVGRITSFDQIDVGYGREVKVYVRVTFDVVPNDGSPTVRIIKTFVADTIEI